MHSATPFHLMVISILFVFPAVGQIGKTTTKFTLKKVSPFKPNNCTTRDEKPGICVEKSICNNAHEIEIGGIIVDSELRTSSDCDLQKGEWCCSEKNVMTIDVATNKMEPTVVTEVNLKKGKNCVVSDGKDYPWFVKLYRDQKYPYCVGAVIGSKTILTTATCSIQAQNQVVWARVPGSANPEANYTVIDKLVHPEYNSGTRLNDLALFITLSSITWGDGSPKGACIDSGETLRGECIGITVNEYEDIHLVSLYVTKGACFTGGNVFDAMCGNGLLLDNLMHGAPIVCQKNNMYILTGLTRTPYPSDSEKALLGNLDYTWLMNNLRGNKIGLKDAEFLYKHNY